jgi:transcriptional regulator with XRE-family HTH domain
MLELTKKPRTDGRWEICAIVPENRVNFVTVAIEEAATPSVPASEVFPNSTPGTRLRGARGLMGMTQAKLAEKLGVRVQNISAMENDRRPIGKAMAKKIEVVLEFPYQALL